MPFDPLLFEAQVALKEIPTEKLPSIAQDAMEAGFDGPCVVNMAVTEPMHLWKIDQALPPMLAELGLQQLSNREAALRLAVRRAERILASGEDPLLSLGYFFSLMLASDYMRELTDLAYLEDVWPSDHFSRDEQQAAALEMLRVLVSPELRQEPVIQQDPEVRLRQYVEKRRQQFQRRNKPSLLSRLRDRFLL